MRTIISLLLLANIALANQQDYVENRGIDDPELYEGDMKLTMDQRMEVESRGERAAINVQLWPNGEIIYDLDPTFSSEPRAMARLNEAIAEYRQKTCIRFKKRTTEKAYILVITRSGCWSYIGRIGKAQKLSLGKNCWYKGTVIHEFAHALGFIHEQSRPDRDDYVEIKYENILLGQEGNFKKHASANSQGTPYDYYSVMHYSAKLFSKNGQPTLVPKKPGVSLNYRNGLSPIDVQEINMLYKCKTVTPVSPTVPPTHAPQTPAPPTRPPITQAPQTQVPPGTTSFKCNFDQDICGFTQKSNDKFDWLRRSGRTPSSQTGPATDHTTGHGSYMYIETSAPRRPNDNAVIDRQVTLTGNSCLMFYYHMYGLDVNALNVYLGGSKIFTMQGNQGNAWKIAEVRLSGTGRPQTLSFEGVRGASYRGDIAVDDIMVQECQGVNVPTTQAPTPLPTQPPTKPPTRPPTQQSSFKCTFEQTCGFSQRKDDKFDWTRRRGTTPSSQTGPDGDHTTKNGYYMYIEASYPRRKGDSAVMERSVSVSSNTCLTFYYNMYGFHIGTLNVRLGNQVVFTKSGPQGKQWVKAEVPLKTVGTHTLSIEGIRGVAYQGDIAVDDIALQDC